MSVHKRFDPTLFQQNDEAGRLIVKNFFQGLGIRAIDNPDPYAVDLVLSRDDKPIGYAEVEVRHNWKTDEFPYDTLNVPERKEKLLRNPLPTYFFSINCIGTRMLVATDEVVLTSPLQENPNKYVKSGELFYKVALDRCKMIKLQ